jgi:hypothetical protein
MLFTAIPKRMPPSQTRAPIFIVGLGRSGSTLLSCMLDTHSQLAIFPETWMFVSLDELGLRGDLRSRWQHTVFMNRLWKTLKGYKDPAARIVASQAAKYPSYLGSPKTVIQQLGHSYAEARGAQIWGEKTPSHALHLVRIRDLFPDARVIFTIRDPRDVLVSYCERWNQGQFDAHYVMEAAANVRNYINHLLYRPGFSAQQIHWVRYELLATQTEAVLREVCAFLGIAFEAGMLTFYRSQQDVEQATPEGVHHKLLKEPVSAKRVGRFREAFSPSVLMLIEGFLGEELKALGYAPEGGRACILTPEEHRAWARGNRLYQATVAGTFRRGARRRLATKVWACRLLGSVVKLLPSVDLAITAEDWRKRAQEAAAREFG